MVKIDEVPDTHSQLRNELASMREREAPEPGDLDPDFLPQETLRRTGDSSYERVAPSDNWAGDEPEVRSDFFEHRLERAAELKEEANALFKGGDFAEAKRIYRRAFHHIDYTDLERLQFAEHHSKMIDDGQLPILLNLAQSALKLAEQRGAAPRPQPPARSGRPDWRRRLPARERGARMQPLPGGGRGDGSGGSGSGGSAEPEAAAGSARHTYDNYQAKWDKWDNEKFVEGVLRDDSSASGASRAAEGRPDKQLRAAVVYCEAVLRFDKDNVKALYRRGLARERSGNAEDALPDFRRAKALSTKGDASYGTIVRALRRASVASKIEREERAQTWKGKLNTPIAPARDADTPEGSPAAVEGAGAGGSGQAEASPPPVPYIAAEGFAGAKPGYVFKSGDDGVGYYLDGDKSAGGAEPGEVQAAAKKEAVKAVRPALKTSGVWAERGAKLKASLCAPHCLSLWLLVTPFHFLLSRGVP